MGDERTAFLENLNKLVEIGKSKKSVLDVEEINDFFKNENLSVEQLEYIYQYLEDHRIDVLRMLDVDVLIDDDLILDKDEDGFRPEDEEEIDLDAIDLLEGIGTEDPVRMYLKEIGTVPLLTPDEETELAKRKAAGDIYAKERLIESNLRLVVSIAKRYTGR